MTELSESTSPILPLRVSKGLQGAAWKLLSCAAFAGINGVVRYLSSAENTNEPILSTYVMMFFQNVFGTLFILPFVWKSGFSSIKTAYPGLHSLRIITAVLGIALWYLSLKYMPIAKSVALSFTGPVFTVIAACWFLNEKLTLQRIISLLLCLLGAFIISRPDLAFVNSHAMNLIFLLPLGSALTLAWNKILTRKLSGYGESPESLAMYLLLFMAPVSLLPATLDWTWPQQSQWPWLILLGALATTAHLAFGRAYQAAEVTFLTPFGFSKFLFSTAVGIYFFQEIPSQALWIGISIISLSIILLAYKIHFNFNIWNKLGFNEISK